jgi:hypothetical protein
MVRGYRVRGIVGTGVWGEGYSVRVVILFVYIQRARGGVSTADLSVRGSSSSIQDSDSLTHSTCFCRSFHTRHSPIETTASS